MTLSAKDTEIDLASDNGVVSHDVPSRVLPSGRVIVIGSLGLSILYQSIHPTYSHW